MIRDAEKEIQGISNDIKSIFFGQLSKLQAVAAKAAEDLSQSEEPPKQAYLENLLVPFSGDVPVNLAVALSPDGDVLVGCFLVPGTPFQPVDAEEMRPYISSYSPLWVSIAQKRKASGMIVIQGKPIFVALAPVTTPTGKTTSFVMVGTLLHNPPLLNRINEATRGMQVAVADRRVVSLKELPGAKRDAPTNEPSPIFPETVNFYSGGKWHLGENTFEAALPIHDVFGKEISIVSIRLPRTFSSLASIALGWLTAFVATVGMVFVLPIFWLQSRILLNPLSKLSEQIRNIGDHHLDGNCTYLVWDQKDEFGLVAQSINTMLDALSSKTQHICQVEQRQRALITGMPDCLCVFDVNGNLVAIHKQPDYVHPIPGLIAGEPISPPLFPESDCENLRKAIMEAFRTEKIQMVIISCREADGTYRHFETRISLMDAFFALVILRDMTHEWREREVRQQMESRLAKIQKLESLGNLAASIAHDFNNILAIIQNTLDLTWSHAAVGKEETGAVTTLRQAVSKGTSLTHELMTYAGQTRTAFKREDPNVMVLELEKLMGGVIAHNISLELKLTPGLPKIDVDPHQFWKVIINLLKNASEAMNGSRGRISISTYPFDMTLINRDDFYSSQELIPGPGVIFQIDDTGSGIPRDLIERLFEPFFSTKALGRGLGLATVFGIVGSHNGGIAIESEQGKGSSFRVWLPGIKDPADAPAAPRSDPASAAGGEPHLRPAPAAPRTQARPAPSASARPCVLMVEDDPAILQTTRILLRSMGADTLTAATKREALALFRKHTDSIHLILLDAQIGSLDNVRLLSSFRLRKAGIPTIIVSGHMETKIREMFATEPFNGFLGKPYTMDDLWRILSPFIPLKKPESIQRPFV